MQEHVANMRVMGMFSLKRETSILIYRNRKYSILPVECIGSMLCNVYNVSEIFKAMKGSRELFLSAEKVETA